MSGNSQSWLIPQTDTRYEWEKQKPSPFAWEKENAVELFVENLEGFQVTAQDLQKIQLAMLNDSQSHQGFRMA